MLVGNVPCTNGCCIGLVKEENGKGEEGRISLEGKEKYKGEEDGKRGKEKEKKEMEKPTVR